jgi:hypothetical protein
MKSKYVLAALAASLITVGYAQKGAPAQFGAASVAAKSLRTSEIPTWLGSGARGGVANDDCEGAITITPGATCVPVNATYSGASQTLAPITCDGYTAATAADVWFKFTATGTSTTVRVTGGPGTDPIVELFTGACGSLTSVGCADMTLVGGAENVVYATTVGTTYYYRTYFWPYGTPPSDFSFTTCVFATPPAPVNDLCTGATAQNLSVGGTITATGTSMGALDTEGLQLPTAWEAFTLSACADVRISYCGTAEGQQAGLNAIFPSCPPDLATAIFQLSGETTSCANGQVTSCYRGLAAGTYYVPVLGGVSSYTLQVSATACSTSAPANDNCPQAIAITPLTWCNPSFYTTEGATQSMPGEDCDGFTGTANDDVWFSFVATATDMTVGVQGVYDLDAVVLVMSGSCGSLTTIGCADMTLEAGLEQAALTGLTVGNTYYVRVHHWYSTSACDNGFSICVVQGGTVIGMNEQNGADWSVFPNPSNGTFTVTNGGNNALVDMQVIDLGGRMVHSTRVQMNAGAQHVLDLAGKVAAGSYYLRVVEGERSHVQRLMVN